MSGFLFLVDPRPLFRTFLENYLIFLYYEKVNIFFFSLISFTSVQSQCNSNPYLVSGWGGTLLLSDSSSISTGSSTNYSVSYLWDFGDGFISNQQNPCQTYGDISTLPNPCYVTLTVKIHILIPLLH